MIPWIIFLQGLPTRVLESSLEKHCMQNCEESVGNSVRYIVMYLNRKLWRELGKKDHVAIRLSSTVNKPRINPLGNLGIYHMNNYWGNFVWSLAKKHSRHRLGIPSLNLVEKHAWGSCRESLRQSDMEYCKEYCRNLVGNHVGNTLGNPLGTI